MGRFKDFDVQVWNTTDFDLFEGKRTHKDLLNTMNDWIDIWKPAVFMKPLANVITKLELKAGDEYVKFTFEIELEHWEKWIDAWTVANREESRETLPVIIQMSDYVIQWGERHGIDVDGAESEHRSIFYRRQPTV